MHSFASEKHFDYNEESMVNLLYCGLRENCLDHKYASHKRDNHILTLVNRGVALFNINGEKIQLSENYSMFCSVNAEFLMKLFPTFRGVFIGLLQTVFRLSRFFRK